jgi:hypothetical protein
MLDDKIILLHTMPNQIYHVGVYQIVALAVVAVILMGCGSGVVGPPGGLSQHAYTMLTVPHAVRRPPPFWDTWD